MPPFGLNLFAARAIFNVPMGTIYRGVLPFVVVNFLALLVITYVPAISMVLLGGRIESMPALIELEPARFRSGQSCRRADR